VAALVETGKWSESTARLAERADYRCEYCGYDLLASVDAYKLFEVDHVVPLSMGGDPINFENLALACRHCNFHWKRSWDPRQDAGYGADRPQLIDAVKKRVAGIRQTKTSDLDEVRRIVGYNVKNAQQGVGSDA